MLLLNILILFFATITLVFTFNHFKTVMKQRKILRLVHGENLSIVSPSIYLAVNLGQFFIVGFGSFLNDENMMKSLLYGWAIVVTILIFLICAVFMYTGEYRVLLKEYKESQRPYSLIESYFGNFSSGDEGEKNRDNFFEAFGYTVFRDENRVFFRRFNQDTNFELVLRAATLYHEYCKLLKISEGLPLYHKLDEEDKKRSDSLTKTIREMRAELKKFGSEMKPFFNLKGDERYSKQELKKLRELRDIKDFNPVSLKGLHPTIETLHFIQKDPNVSFEKKEEARQLEHQVKQILSDADTPMLSADETSDGLMNAVKMFHRIQT